MNTSGCSHIISMLTLTLPESITPLPSLGLQLSTTRGLSFPHPSSRLLIPLSTSHTFVPLSEISTVVINEGLRRWSVRYYLAVVRKRGEGVLVAFDVNLRSCVL